MTLPEFLAWEARQELRYEFDGFAPVAMTGGTLAHDRITSNLKTLLDRALAGPCEAYGPNVKILVQGRARYPDAVVSCAVQHPQSSIWVEPVVVFEVVSDGNPDTDRIVKVNEYLATQSILRYVILEQKSVGAMVLTRRDDAWHVTALRSGDTLKMPEVGIAIPLDDC